MPSIPRIETLETRLLLDGTAFTAFEGLPIPKDYFRSIAVLDVDVEASHDRILLKGDTPSPIDPPQGCRFWQRCPNAMVGCEAIPTEMVDVEPVHQVACHLVSGFSPEHVTAGLDQPVSSPPVT